MAKVDTSQHLWWLASRASGVVAMVLLTITVLMGLLMGGKLVKRFIHRDGRGAFAVKSLLQNHEQFSIAALIAIAVHGLTLLGDAYMNMSLRDIAVPFADSYRAFYVGLGIIAGYVAALLGLSFYLRSRIGMATWRKWHRFTIAAYGLAVVHTIGAGTDSVSGWLRIPLLASAALVAVTFATRALTAGKPLPTVDRRARERRRRVVTVGERP